MTIRWALILMLLLTSAAAAQSLPTRLPRPHYDARRSDPDWLRDAVRFHGHLGPWAIAGCRLGMAARQAVGAHGYFDVEVTVRGPFDRPPRSCFLDGVQVTTGATLGKRNLHWVEAERIAVRMRNTNTGQVVELRPSTALLNVLGSIKPSPAGDHDHDHHAGDHDHAHHAGAPHDAQRLETLARRIAAMPDGQLFERNAAPDSSASSPGSAK